MTPATTRTLWLFLLLASAGVFAAIKSGVWEPAGVRTVSTKQRGGMATPSRTASPEAEPSSEFSASPAPEAAASAEARPTPEASAIPEATTTTTPPATVPPRSTPRPSAPPSFARQDLGGLAAALERVEEKRGVPERLQVPSELQHYGDRRRFLAIQMAATREDDLDMPHDEPALAEMILRGELVELAPVTEDHVLYQIGEDVDIDPLTHYDVEDGKDVPLFASMEDFEREDARLAQEAAGPGREAAKARARRELLESHYRNPALREQLFREHAAITRLARDFGGVSYDLSHPESRGRFVSRLLSFLRAPARDLLLPVARAYRQKFARPLPIASLVRTIRYQRRLTKVNRNASRVDLSPHTSGEAFDIDYKFMANDEQNFLMTEFARLERLGRVEALRERNNSLHVYVFVSGHPPSETRVAGYLDDVGEAHPRAALRRGTTGAAHTRAAMKRF